MEVSNNLNYQLLSSALSQFNTQEYSGKKHNAEILKYFRAAGYPNIQSDEVAWCAAFANWVLAENGLEGSGKLTAQSLLSIGEPVKEPMPGDLVIFWRGRVKSWQGHVGFFVKQTKSYVYVLGGNQSNRVSIAAYSKDKLLGYRRLIEADTTVKPCSHTKQPVIAELITPNMYVDNSMSVGVELVFLGDTDYITPEVQQQYIHKIECEMSGTFKIDFNLKSRRLYHTEHTLEGVEAAAKQRSDYLEILHSKYNDNPKNITIFVITSNGKLEGFSSAALNSVFVDISSDSKYSSTLSHQAGHLLGLNHLDVMTDQEKLTLGIEADLDKFNLMNNNIYGKLLSNEQIGYAQNIAVNKYFL